MKKSYHIFLLTFIVVVAGCNRLDDNQASPQSELNQDVLVQKSATVAVPKELAYNRQDLDNKIITLQSERKDFHWEWTDMRTLWSAAILTDQIVLGYKPANIENIDPIIHQLNLQSKEWKSVHDALLDLVLKGLNKNGQTVTLNDIIVEDDQVLPILVLRVTDKDVEKCQIYRTLWILACCLERSFFIRMQRIYNNSECSRFYDHHPGLQTSLGFQ